MHMGADLNHCTRCNRTPLDLVDVPLRVRLTVIILSVNHSLCEF